MIRTTEGICEPVVLLDVHAADLHDAVVGLAATFEQTLDVDAEYREAIEGTLRREMTKDKEASRRTLRREITEVQSQD